MLIYRKSENNYYSINIISFLIFPRLIEKKIVKIALYNIILLFCN